MEETHEEKPETVEQKPQEEENFQDKLERWCDGFVNSINYDRLKLWKEVGFHPTKEFTDELGKGTLMRGAKDVWVANLPIIILQMIVLAFVAVYFVLIGGIFAIALGSVGMLMLLGMIVLGVLGLVLYIGYPVIFWLIGSAVQYIIAKLLGGRANFTDHSYVIALGSASAASAISVLTIISMIPCIGWILRPIIMLIGFYGIYLNYKAVKIAHGFDTTKAAVVVLAPVVIWMLMVVGLLVAFYLGLFSLVALGGAASS